MNTSEIIALGLAGVALYFIVNQSKAQKAQTWAPSYTTSDFGSSAWSEAINTAANSRLQRQGSI